MSKDPRHYPWWGFWRVMYVPVLIHAILMVIGTAVYTSTYNLSYGKSHVIQWEVLSLWDSAAIVLCNETWPIILGGSFVALISFLIARKRCRFNRALLFYAVLQSVVGIIISASYVYLILRGPIITFTTTTTTQIGTAHLTAYLTTVWIWREYLDWLWLFSLASAPLFVLALRGLWVLIVKPKPDVDADGRYLVCVSCSYNLHGTESLTCPECGESVKPEVAIKSTVADS